MLPCSRRASIRALFTTVDSILEARFLLYCTVQYYMGKSSYSKEISTRSQTDTKSTQTDTRSQTVVKQTSRSERTHIRLHKKFIRVHTVLYSTYCTVLTTSSTPSILRCLGALWRRRHRRAVPSSLARPVTGCLVPKRRPDKQARPLGIAPRRGSFRQTVVGPSLWAVSAVTSEVKLELCECSPFVTSDEPRRQITLSLISCARLQIKSEIARTLLTAPLSHPQPKVAGQWHVIDTVSAIDCVVSPCGHVQDIPVELQEDWARGACSGVRPDHRGTCCWRYDSP